VTWIPLYSTVFSDPKVTRAADRLNGGDVYQLVGHLAALWLWTIDNSESGDLSHLRPQAVANAAGWTGSARRFVNVLISVGLLDEGPKVHKADKYFGRLVARRQHDRDRKELARLAEKQAKALESSAGTSTGGLLEVQAVQTTETGDSDSDKTTTTLAKPVTDDEVATNVSRALVALGRVPWYPLSERLDRHLLHDAAARAPGQDLAADVRRWGRTAKRETTRRPRSALKAWLEKFGDQDRPVDRPPSFEVIAAEHAYHANPSRETLDALWVARGEIGGTE
jgi:hypothetical protein